VSSLPEGAAAGEDRAPGQTESGNAEGDSTTGAARPSFTCDLCGHVMLDLHCKLVCERCGYKRDCSDP